MNDTREARTDPRMLPTDPSRVEVPEKPRTKVVNLKLEERLLDALKSEAVRTRRSYSAQANEWLSWVVDGNVSPPPPAV